MEKIYITKTVKFEASPSELDFENREAFGWEDHDTHDFNELTNSIMMTDVEPISIEKLIGILHQAQAAGSTHIAIEYHSDHIGYDITGIEMRPSTDEEVLDHVEKKRSEQEKRRKIHDLKAQIAKIENSDDQ